MKGLAPGLSDEANAILAPPCCWLRLQPALHGVRWRGPPGIPPRPDGRKSLKNTFGLVIPERPFPCPRRQLSTHVLGTICHPCLRAGHRFRWSGRWESNPRHTAWEAVVLPLNYARDRSVTRRMGRPLGRRPTRTTQHFTSTAGEIPAARFAAPPSRGWRPCYGMMPEAAWSHQAQPVCMKYSKPRSRKSPSRMTTIRISSALLFRAVAASLSRQFTSS